MTRSNNRFLKNLNGIRETQLGQERNMYPYIKNILVNTLGHETNKVFTDTAITSRAIAFIHYLCSLFSLKIFNRLSKLCMSNNETS